MPYSSDLSYNDVIAIDIFLERYQTRIYVGRLQMLENLFHFEYSDAYMKAKNVISLGPEFPFTQKDFYSKTLFSSIEDRIPDRDNPAYETYCREFGISPLTKNPLVLLSTIGRRGPSSFIFEPVYGGNFTFEDFDNFRIKMGLTLQDAALLFDVSLSILQKLKVRNASGKEVLKRLELYCRFEKPLMLQIKRNGRLLHSDKIARIYEALALDAEQKNL